MSIVFIIFTTVSVNTILPAQASAAKLPLIFCGVRLMHTFKLNAHVTLWADAMSCKVNLTKIGYNARN